MVTNLSLFTRRVGDGQAWTNPIVLLVCGNGFRGSLGLSCGIFKMASLILIALQTRNFVFDSNIFIRGMFCKIYRYPEHRKALSWGKLLLTLHYRTLTKQNCHVGQVLFVVNLFSIFGWVVRCFFPRTTSLLLLLKIGCPVNFLVVSDDR